MLVLITLNPPEKELKKLVRKFPDVTFSTSFADIVRADVVFGWLIDKRIVGSLKRLKWFHTAGIQYAHLLPRGLYKKAAVTNSRGVWGEYVAVSFFERLLQKFPPEYLRGKTAGIIGYGGNGRACADRALKYKMHVLAVKRPPKASKRGVQGVIKISDLIFVTVPLTKETRRLLGEKEFGMMKKGTIVLSASGPDVFDRGAFKKALSSNKIRLAVLDELWPDDIKGLKRVETFPHASPFHYNVWPKMFKIFAVNLERFIDGRPLLNKVTP